MTGFFLEVLHLAHIALPFSVLDYALEPSLCRGLTHTHETVHEQGTVGKKKSLVIARINPQVQVLDRRYGPATRSREPEWLRPRRADENCFEFFLAHNVYARGLHPNYAEASAITCA